MKLEQYYRVEVVALSVIALLAAASAWMTVTSPGSGWGSSTVAILWFVGTVFYVVLSVRRQLGIIDSARVRPWMLLVLSLFVFFGVFSAVGQFDTYGVDKIVSFIMFSVLAVFLLFATIVKYLRLVEELG